MKRLEAIRIIDEHKNTLIDDPVKMLDWTWIRVILSHLPDTEWDAAVDRAMPDLSR